MRNSIDFLTFSDLKVGFATITSLVVVNSESLFDQVKGFLSFILIALSVIYTYYKILAEREKRKFYKTKEKENETDKGK